jgi:hypothetical protein
MMNRIACPDTESADDRNNPDFFQGFIFFDQRLAERSQRARPAPASKGDFLNNPGHRQDGDTDKIRNQVRRTAVSRRPVGKGPNIRHPHCRAYTGNNKSMPARKEIP